MRVTLRAMSRQDEVKAMIMTGGVTNMEDLSFVQTDLAEKAAWDFIQHEGKGLEFATVNPVGVMGPILGNDYSHSNVIVRQMLEGKLKAVPKIYSDYVGVRDVAELHILEMIRPEASGGRSNCSHRQK